MNKQRYVGLLLVAVLWLGASLLAAGDTVEGLGRLVTLESPPVPQRLAAGLELTRSCAALLPAGEELYLWSSSGPADPEEFGFLWMLASYREYPRPVVPLFPPTEIDRLEALRLLDADLAALLRLKSAALSTRLLPIAFVAWSDRPDDPPRCESFAIDASSFEIAGTNEFGRCCITQQVAR